MKKLILSTVVASLPLFAYEVHFNKTFKDSLEPNILATKISVQIKAKSESIASNRLEKFNDFIKKSNDIKKSNGSFYVRSNFIYDENKTKQDGYVGRLSYDISSKDSKKITSFIKKFLSIKEDKSTSVNISNLSWKIDENISNEKIEKMRLDAIKWAVNYSNNLSNDLKKECKVKNIDINSYYNPNVYRASTKLILKENISNDAIPIPDNNSKDIKITANYSLECN
ncbi:SIMPL domain-containing protein [Arcobacter sp. CECT 8985]|uniref:SIMPL domain-containing protein n=1 Tax=Arcobacter sp. CECT 8985 TaxID=1935424 RepID=UPI00100B77E8|nr:SIMPL domain-containing protein [Arcobacter sp. CECT 8985]RXJ86891.1 hypothetical protein CRU93_06735 [Arcobacter sp. CECT 8985]